MTAKLFVFYLFALLAGLTAVRTAPLVLRDEASGTLAVANRAATRGILSDISNITAIADTASILKKIGSVGAAGAATLVGAVDERDEEATAARAIGERQVGTAGASGSLAIPSFNSILSVGKDVASLFGDVNTVAKTFNVSASSIF